MGLESGLDTFLIFFLLLISLIGLIRGFLKELVSIINWFGAVYFTSLFKPIFIKLFLQNFKFPFLVDIIANSVLFVVFVLIMSALNKIIIEKIREYIPLSINSGLGFLFGFFKGILIISLSLTCVNVVYGDIKPDYLAKSIINNMIENNDGVLTNIINSLMGDFIRKKTESISGIIDNVNNTKSDDNEDNDEKTPMIQKNELKKILNNKNKKKLKKKIDEIDLDKLMDNLID
jgi:membrane protein required for colicin V production